MQLTETDYSKNMYWVVGVVLDKTINTQIVMSKLSDKGIDTRPFFYPLHKQPLLKKYQLDVQESLPTSELIGSQGFYLPSFLGLSEDDIGYICGELVESLV
jgi:perosamine synthetase